MGLGIKKYGYSYSTLHLLRQLALKYENIEIDIRSFYEQTLVTTKFKQFILHSDCDGLYISKTSKQYEKIKSEIIRRYGQLEFYFGDLDELKREVQELNNYVLKNTKGYLQNAWIDFYDDVMSSKKILRFG